MFENCYYGARHSVHLSSQLLRRQRLGRSQFKDSSGKKVNLSTNKPGIVAHICNPSYVGGIDRRITVHCQLRAKTNTLPEKIMQKSWVMDQVVALLPSKCEVLSSNTSTNKAKMKTNNNKENYYGNKNKQN
jgi:hypothetical protein